MPRSRQSPSERCIVEIPQRANVTRLVAQARVDAIHGEPFRVIAYKGNEVLGGAKGPEVIKGKRERDAALTGGFLQVVPEMALGMPGAKDAV